MSQLCVFCSPFPGSMSVNGDFSTTGSCRDAYGTKTLVIPPEASCTPRPSYEPHAETGAFLFCASVHYKFAYLKPSLHFPYVLSVIALCSVHGFAGIILGHRRCLLGTVDKSKTRRLMLGSSLSLQPLVHPRNSLTKTKAVNYQPLPDCAQNPGLPGQ